MSNNAWEYAQSLANKHSQSGGTFIRLTNDGDKVVGVFCGDPHAREMHWTGDRYIECDSSKNCEHCKAGKRSKLRVMLNFYVIEEGQMKIIEGGSGWFKNVMTIREKYGLDNWSFEVQRHGSSGDPKTNYSILPDDKINPTLKQQIAAASLHELAQINASSNNSEQPQAQSQASQVPKQNASEDRVIEISTAMEILAELKKLPRSDAQAFLDEFNIKKVRELKAKDLDNAKLFIGSLAASVDEIDPFF